MKRALLVACLALPALGFASPTDLVKRHLPSIMQITWEGKRPGDEKSNTHYCTAFQVGLIRALTAEHCVPPAEVGADVLMEGVVLRVVKRNDWLALLEAPEGRVPLLIAKEKPRVGTPVWAFGNAYSEGIHTFGRSVAFSHPQGWLVTDGPFAGGMSGGPLLDEHGKVVGVIQAGNTIIGLSTNVDDIRKFLK